MFKKQAHILEKEQSEPSTLLSTLLETHPLEVEEALLERDLFDDHGPVILGDRKDPPVFSQQSIT